MSDVESKFAPGQYPVVLSAAQRAELEAITRNGHAAAKTIRHAQVLLLSDHARPETRRSGAEIAAVLDMHLNTVARIRKRFCREGILPALHRKQRAAPPCPPILDGAAEAQLIAICCSDPPTGRTCWTMQLLADQLMHRKIVTQISAETVRRHLKKRAAAVEEAVLVHSRA